MFSGGVDRGSSSLAPWLSALACWHLSLAVSSSYLALASGAFALLGLLGLCPLYRGPLVRLGEGMLATLDFLEPDFGEHCDLRLR